MTDKHIINFLLISDDPAGIMTLTDEFRKDKIANPLFVEDMDSDVLNMIKQKSKKENTPLNNWIVLLDMKTQPGNGFQILKNIQGHPELQNINIFVITSSPDIKTQIEAAKYKVSGYIEKPVTFDKLAAAISILNYKWHLTDEGSEK